MTTTSPYISPNPLRLRLRSSSEGRDDSSSFICLDTDLITWPSTPSSIEFNIDQNSDEPATPSLAAQKLIKKLRRAKDFLQSPNNLSKDELAKRHKEIRGLLQTLKDEYGETVELDLELYDQVNVWIHLRTTPEGAIGGKRRGVAVRPTENAAVLPEAQKSPTENNRSSLRAHSRRSAITKARDTTLLGVQPGFSTMEQALNRWRRSNDSITKSQKNPRPYPESNFTNAASEPTPTPTPQELPDLASTHRQKASTPNISNSTPQPFLMAETTHLQALMSAQIEHDLIHGKSFLPFYLHIQCPPTPPLTALIYIGNLETEKGNLPHDFRQTVPATVQFALPRALEREVEVARGLFFEVWVWVWVRWLRW